MKAKRNALKNLSARSRRSSKQSALPKNSPENASCPPESFTESALPTTSETENAGSDVSTGPNAESFERAIAESKAKLESEPVPRRKRGRPSKAEIAARTMASGDGVTGDSSGVEASVQPDSIPRVIVSQIVQLPFEIASSRTKFAGWKLAQEETDALVPCIQTSIAKRMPSEASPNADLYILAGTLAVMVTMKWYAMQEWLTLEREKLKKEQDGKPSIEIAKTGINASTTPEFSPTL